MEQVFFWKTVLRFFKTVRQSPTGLRIVRLHETVLWIVQVSMLTKPSQHADEAGGIFSDYKR